MSSISLSNSNAGFELEAQIIAPVGGFLVGRLGGASMALEQKKLAVKDISENVGN